jgi:hypothetical protein
MNQNNTPKTKEELETLEWFRNFHNLVLSNVYKAEDQFRSVQLNNAIIYPQTHGEVLNVPNVFDAIYQGFGMMFKYIYDAFPVRDSMTDRQKKMVKEADFDFVLRHRERLDVRTVPCDDLIVDNKTARLEEIFEYCKTMLSQLKSGYESGNLDSCWMNYARLKIINY